MGTTTQYLIQGKKGRRFSDQLRGINLEQVLIVAIDPAKLSNKKTEPPLVKAVQPSDHSSSSNNSSTLSSSSSSWAAMT